MLKKVVGRKLGIRQGNGDDVASVSDFSNDDVVTHQVESSSKMGRVQLIKAYRFLNGSTCKYTTLIWVAVCSIIMVIHYKLFKRGTWRSHLNDQERFGLFDFCSRSERNPAAKALTNLANIIYDPEGAGRSHMLPLLLKFGLVSRWPKRVLTTLHVCLVVAFCLLWRKLFFVFSAFPWLLVPAVDPRSTAAERKASREHFHGAPNCCLDKGCGQVVRALVPEVRSPQSDNYFGPRLGSFLRVLFERVVVTSTFVERVFSHLSAWTDTPQSLPTLAAKYTNVTFMREVGRWRKTRAIVTPSRRERPPWMKWKNPGAHTTGLSLFRRDWRGGGGDGDGDGEEIVTEEIGIGNTFGDRNRLIVLAWKALPHERRSAYRREALAKRTVATVAATPLERSCAMTQGEFVGGPNGIASLEGPFHIRSSAVEEALRAKGSFSTLAANWCKEYSGKVYPNPAFPDTVTATTPCCGGCRNTPMPDHGLDTLKGLMTSVQLILRHRDAADVANDPTVLLEFTAGDVREFVLVGHCQSLNNDMYEAECLQMHVVADGDAADIPFLLEFTPGDFVLGCAWPTITCEVQYLRSLASRAPVWEIHVLKSEVAALSERVVVGRALVDYGRLRAKEAEELVLKQAMRAFNMVASARRARAGGGGGRERGESRGRGRGPDPGGEVTSSASSSSEVEENEEEQYWREVVQEARAKGKKTKKKPGEPPAPAASVPAPAPAGRESRVVGTIGPASIATIMRSGEKTGFGITCGRHLNDADTYGTVCKKALTIGKSGISDEEAVRRLKRWFVAGLQDTDWDAVACRKTHGGLGGMQLRDYGDDTAWGEISDADLAELASAAVAG